MKRREFIKRTTAGAMSLTLSNWACQKEKGIPERVVPEDAPNVLFIVIDDLNDWIMSGENI